MLFLQSNTEPLAGYRLLEPLGQGGFGEVWKCEAPGGLVKAIKFVAGKRLQFADAPNGDAINGDVPNGADQEFRALQHVKSIRHPFLLSMDRIEVVDDDLLIVMELADRSLHDLLEEYRQKGYPGIPRDELLGYLREAAEVLDLMNQQHHLQHLDVKPRNLFLVGRHIKVADFGLVNSVAEMSGNNPSALQPNAITPVYAAPESFLGKVSQASDQYSLAVAYHELLTGQVLFRGKNFSQLAMQHLQSVPNLSALPEGDRAAVARALAKEPTERFPSCGEFVQALSLGLTNTTELAAPPEPAQETKSIPRLGDTKMPRVSSTVRQPDIPTTSAEELGSFRLLECLSRPVGGELWRGLAPDGGKRIIRFLTGADGETLTRLGRLQHSSLAKVKVVYDGPHRIVLATEAGDENLISRLKECTKAGLAGVPRPELLDLLADVAAALDDLYENHGVRHLTLSPRTVALVGGKARLLDFGLAELFWLPAGQQPGALNPRYAAPELFDGVITRHADQYSLALLFHEMLTGMHPFRERNARQMASSRQRGVLKLGPLSPNDRDFVLRALNPNPELRFPSCSDFIDALADLPMLSPPSSVAVKTISPITVASARAVNELLVLARDGREVRQRIGIRYFLEPGRSILHHCCGSLARAMLPVKLSSFCDQWHAQLVQRTGDECFRFRVPLPGTLWQRTFGPQPSLVVEVCSTFPTDSSAKLTGTCIRIWPEACHKVQALNLLNDVGLSLLESLRACLNVEQDVRGELRLPCVQPVKVAPIISGRPGDPIESITKDVSQTGMGLLMPHALPPAQVCVLVSLPSQPDPARIDACVVRNRRQMDGRIEVGLKFV